MQLAIGHDRRVRVDTAEGTWHVRRRWAPRHLGADTIFGRFRNRTRKVRKRTTEAGDIPDPGCAPDVGEAIAVLHDAGAAPDGVRKIDQARTFVRRMDGPDIPAFKSFAEGELDLALGGGNVIHAAILDGQPGRAALRHLVFLDRFRHFSAEFDTSGGASEKTAKDKITE